MSETLQLLHVKQKFRSEINISKFIELEKFAKIDLTLKSACAAMH